MRKVPFLTPQLNTGFDQLNTKGTSTAARTWLKCGSGWREQWENHRDGFCEWEAFLFLSLSLFSG